MVATQQRALKRNLATKFLNFTQTKFYTFLCWFLTFNFINLAWIFFRAENLQGALNLLKSMFGVVWVELPAKWHRMPESLAQISGRNDTIFYILIAILLCVLAKNSAKQMLNTKIIHLIIAGLVFTYCFFTLSANSYNAPFLYFNF